MEAIKSNLTEKVERGVWVWGGCITISAAYIAITAASTFFSVFREKLRGERGGEFCWSGLKLDKQGKRRWL